MSEILSRLQAALEGRYSVEREIGEGGMAIVYLATDLRHQRQVALKVLRPELAATLGPERFLQEVRVTANLQHPHILPLFDSGEAAGFLYYVMPYLEGESLRERLTRERELPVPDAVKILKEVVDALAAAHAKGVVHRDVKPDNVMLSGRHALVTDFGVAKAVSEATGRHKLTTKGVALGTPAYMAPEQAAADSQIDHRADIYAVGALGYELLTGRPPFSGMSPQQVLSAQVTQTPRPVTEIRPSVPPELGAVLMRCLEKNPADRWQRAEELLAHLEAFAATPSGGLTPTQMTPVAGRGSRARFKGMYAAVAVVAVLATAGLWWQGRDAGTDGDDATAAAADAESVERLVVAPLQNLTGDPDADVWSKLAASWMARAIDEPRPVDVVPASTVLDALRALGDTASVASLAAYTGAVYAVAGTVARTGDRVRFEVELLDLRTGERLRTLDPIAGPVDSVEAVVSRLADRVAATAVVQLDPSAPPWTAASSPPPSVELFRQHLEQGELFCRGRYEESIEVGDRILAEAPDFIGPLATNRVAYSNLGRGMEADSVTPLLEALTGRMTRMERAQHDWMNGNIYGDPQLATRAADESYRLDPRGWGYAAGLTYLRTGRVSESVERFLTVDREAPCNRDWVPWWVQIGNAYHLLGRYEEELAVARDGLERFPDRRSLMDHEADAFAAMGRVEAVDSLLDVMAGLPPQAGFSPGLRPLWAGLELRAHGHETAAEAQLERALEWFARQPPDEDRYNRGRAFYYAGRLADADTLFAALLEEDPENRLYLGFHGAALARLGRREAALELSRRLGDLESPNLRGRHIGAQAVIAAALGDRDDAVRLLQEAFANGQAYGTWIHTEPAFEGMWGYSPWEALVRAR